MPDSGEIPRQIPKFPDHIRSASVSKMPVRKDVVLDHGNAPKPTSRVQGEVRAVASKSQNFHHLISLVVQA